MSNCSKCGAPVGWSGVGLGLSGKFRHSDEADQLEAIAAFGDLQWSLEWEEWPDGKVFWVVKDIERQTVADGNTPIEAVMNAIGNQIHEVVKLDIDCIHEPGVLKRLAVKVLKFFCSFI